MDNNLKSYLKDIDTYTDHSDITRWQLQIHTYLKEAYGSQVAEKFLKFGKDEDLWNASAKQKGFLQALILVENNKETTEVKESMRRIDRLNLIDRIGRHLQSEMTYADIEVYLLGFNIDTDVPTTDNGGSKWKYVKELLAKETDKKILEIADELEIDHGYSHNIIEVIPDSTFWHTNHFRLFMSHLSSFKARTAQLQESLKDYGISAFVAHEDIEPTKEL